jgi:hypothetical protein
MASSEERRQEDQSLLRDLQFKASEAAMAFVRVV